MSRGDAEIVETITSRSNAKVKRARALRQRKHRQAEGAFVVEGISHVGEAVEAGAEVEALFYAPDLLRSEFASHLIESQAAKGVPCHATSADVFASLAEKDNPQGLLAIVRQRVSSLSELNPGNFPWGVALIAPQDPGNVGTIMRTIDAVGASGLILLDESVDPFYASSLRASMGSIFWLPLAMAPFSDFAEWTIQHGYHVYGTSAHGERDFRQVERYPHPAILLMGSEREGLTENQIGLCEQIIRLPMRGRATSLNLAVATGVMLYAMLEKLEAA